MARSKGKGRGWHGDSDGHAKAGRLGGRASSKSRSEGRESNLSHDDKSRGKRSLGGGRQ